MPGEPTGRQPRQIAAGIRARPMEAHVLRRALRDQVHGRRRAGLTALCAVATALAVAGCGSQLAAGDHGQPPKLHIGMGSGGAGPGATAGEAVPALAPSSGRLGLFGGYVLVGQLPSSPTHAPVWRWPAGPNGTASPAQVTHLGALLGLTGTPQRHAHGWLLASSAGELRVRDGESLAWSYSRGRTDCPPYQVDIDNAGDGGVGCAEASAVPPNAPTVTPESQAPSDAPARALLASLGVSGVEHTDTDLGALVLTVDPTVGSLPTQGIATSVIVDSHGVRSATGHLGVPKAGADYPLRSAKDSFADLGAGPRPMIAQYCGPMPAPEGRPGVAASEAPAPSGVPIPQQCPSPEPIRVTGATIGLLATWDGDSTDPNVLVPAWFFTAEGSPYPLPAIAVDPAFIATPTPDVGPNAGEGSSSAGNSGSGGAPAPPPNSVPPAPAISPVQTTPTS